MRMTRDVVGRGLLLVTLLAPSLKCDPMFLPRAPAVTTCSPQQDDSDTELHEARQLLEDAKHARAEKEFGVARARAAEAIDLLLEEAVTESAARVKALWDLGFVANDLGDPHASQRAWQRVLAFRQKTLPDHHPDLLAVRGNLATTIRQLGDPQGARGLFEKVLEISLRTLPDDHPDLQLARSALALTLKDLGDLQGARVLLEKVLEVYSRTLRDDDPNLQLARGNLAVTIKLLGDVQEARALEEKVLDVRSRTLPDDHPHLQGARQNLATTLRLLGDLRRARPLEEKVLEVRLRTLADDHPDVQQARLNLAGTMKGLADLTGARALEEKVLEVFASTLADNHPDLQRARGNLANTIAEHVARARQSSGIEQEKRQEEESARRRIHELLSAYARALRQSARAAILDASSREAEERAGSLMDELNQALSQADGFGILPPEPDLQREAFLCSETLRSAALISARIALAARGDEAHKDLAERRRLASEELARLGQTGFDAERFDAARKQFEAADRMLVQRGASVAPWIATVLEPAIGSLATRLDDHDALVAFRRYVRQWIAEGDPPTWKWAECMCAFVVRQRMNTGPELTRVELGTIAAIDAAVTAWRDAVGIERERGAAALAQVDDRVGARGRELRALVLDPLADVLSGATRAVVALDDVLHLVPLDALPAADSAEPVGARLRIETRASLLELLIDEQTVPTTGCLLALAPVSFQTVAAPRAEVVQNSESAANTMVARSGSQAGLLRGSAWERGFQPLPATREEVRAVALSFEDAFEDGPAPLLLERGKASRESLAELAPNARYVHVATHGWFAPESIVSLDDPRPLDAQSGLGARLSGSEQVRRLSPMLLCGIALAGANLPMDAAGRIPGLMTAQELATLDLSNCELAVLSACDTNVGVRRAGQGVASLQRALHMAGARSVITSLWKVPDEATKDLMSDFYRRLWIEKKQKAEALWEAKMKLYHAKDELGRPRYSERDWAGWMLTGNPR